MDNLHSIFMAEATELMGDLEKGLLLLESDPSNAEAIGRVFRAMHTIKGSAGMFGFDSVSSLTHQIETVFDSIRNGKCALTPEILRVTFESLDHLHKLFIDPQLNDDALKQAQSFMLKQVEVLLTTSSGSQAPFVNNSTKESHWYYIKFEPNLNILRNGSNTFYLVEDLLAMGEGIAIPYFKDLPALDAIDPQLNYTCFEILLGTTKTEAEIKDVFIFVTSECLLEIKAIPPSDIILTEQIHQQIWQSHSILKPLGYDALCNLIIPVKKQKAEAVSNSTENHRNKPAASSIRVASDRLDELMNLVSELVTTQASLSLFADRTESPGLSNISENVEKITRRLRDNAFTMSLIPIESLVVRFQRLVRDLSKELNKDIIFKTEGVETEIDKSIIEKLTDPLLHLLRNSLDHGIEAPDERLRKGKPKQGVLLLKSYYSGANVIIEITDDGAGINLEKVRSKAISKGLITADAVMDDKELTNLIFMAGFSTAEQVTGVSGRGVGMDVVRRNISDIRGDIEIRTKQNVGTTFSIRLPLTLSIIDGLLVRIGQTDFVLPLGSVSKCYEVETTTLEKSFNQWVTLEGQRTPFLFLRKEFDITHTAPLYSQVIKINHEGHSVGLAVDRIVGEYQAVLKPLGDFYRHQEEYSGATILGDGSVAIVLDPYKLIKKLVDKQLLNLKTA